MTQLARTEGPAPFDVRSVDVGDGHILYVEQCGTRDGVPALYLHGGPGSGCQPSHRTLFDSSRVRAVLFDQRGAGRSRYTQRLFANTTQHLIGDMERIRADLEIDRWVIVGGSWGATLALAYAERHPKHVIGLVLRAVFLGTRRELEWAFLDGLARFRPELYEAFLDALSALERADPLEAYWRRILDPDPAIHRHSAWLWHDVERALSELVPASPMPRPNHATVSLRRRSSRRIIFEAGVSCDLANSSTMRACSRQFLASSCRAGTTCSVHRKPLQRSPSAGETRGSTSSRELDMPYPSPASAMH